MKKLLILSGKGGTGKTTTAAAFISFLNAKFYADCDVDAPNLHLITSHDKTPDTRPYYGSQKATINQNKCVQCGLCKQRCRFNAIEKTQDRYMINEYACEGCGVCSISCNANAITLADDIAGALMLYNGTSLFSTAQLKMGRGNSGKLVTEVKRQLPENLNEIAIIDGSPGIGCPVIASISGVDLVLIVAEPSLSGFSDMKRIIKTTQIFATQAIVCVNKYDICKENTELIKDYCKNNSILYIGEVPYDNTVSKAINLGESIASFDCPAKHALLDLFNKTISILNAK